MSLQRIPIFIAVISTDELHIKASIPNLVRNDYVD